MKVLGLGSIAAAFAVSMAGLSETIVPLKRAKSEGPNKTKRFRPGRTYPHSNTRQRARYARQIAAGQLRETSAA